MAELFIDFITNFFFFWLNIKKRATLIYILIKNKIFYIKYLFIYFIFIFLK